MLSKVSPKKKTDSILISDIKALVVRERRVLSEFLHHLREIENRKLYLKRGFSSLLGFVTQELGYSESAAGRRIQAMRLIKDIPEVEAQVQSGKISLSVASQMQSFFRQENQKRRSERRASISPQEKLQMVTQLAGTSSRQCERKLAQIAPETALPKERVRPLNSDKTQVQFLVDGELMAKIQRLKELTSHQNPEGKLERVFAKAVDLALDQLDPERREMRRQFRRQRKEKTGSKSPVACTQIRALPTSEVVKTEAMISKGAIATRKQSSRHIPNALRDRIWVRDDGQCQHVDPLTGRKCCSRHSVQVDHRYPFSLVPEHTEENLRLLCGAHNRLRWETLDDKQGGSHAETRVDL